jgi:hypothetical protein
MRFETCLALVTAAFVAGVATQKEIVVWKTPKTRAEVAKLMDSLSQDLRKLNIHKSRLDTGYGTLSALGKSLADRSKKVAELVGAGGSQDQLLNATKQMQEAQVSFNMQYLQLQSQMQHENRSYTAISNIMKTKHDTVKNSIANIR